MSIFRKGLLALVIAAVVLVALAGPADAIVSLLGTWKGTFRVSADDTYPSGTLTLTVVNQSGTLFRGTVAVKQGVNPQEILGLTGYVSGTQLRITAFERTPDRPTDSFWDAAYAAGPPATLRGSVRSLFGASGYFSVTKQ